MYLGIDLGTSGVKALLVDDEQQVVDQETRSLEVRRPEALWSEQDPEDWWRATDAAVRALHERRPEAVAAVRGIGLSGQMHGAVLLDAGDRVLRPAILWNDGRSGKECEELERLAPTSRDITGNLAMPGFTAPKLLWVARHEPEIFAEVRRVLLPKDWLRLRLSGERASDPSDAAGTLWLDVAKRAWSEEMLAATRLGLDAMPRLVEGSRASGTLRAAVAGDWGMSRAATIAGGGGDNAAGAVGVGVVRPGQALLSLGTSGVYFVAGERFAPNPRGGVHAFCHCLPDTWHQMSVILSAASCLDWVATLTGAGDARALLAEVEAAGLRPGSEVFLPYLSGERTPHNDPDAKGVFFGLTHATTRADLARAVLEGVAFALADGQAALVEAGTEIGSVTVIGGGARSALWGVVLASALDRPLAYRTGAEFGPAYGAARLARLACGSESIDEVCTAPPLESVTEPDLDLRECYPDQYRRYRDLYPRLREAFAAPGARGDKP